ncbi:unnamed protein product [Mytilus edulis]|uniref:C-type lectin domain-containing protein n=1 Tax=Mytilus edulis TaxID=6550 RepID=A0A8S3Q4F9_MYTED|nr:unnamed protein product [Mytilus edulis]
MEYMICYTEQVIDDDLTTYYNVGCRSRQVCFTQQFVNANFEKRFNLGCEKKKRCDLLRELAPHYRSLQLCNQCCQGSECNKKLCSVECYHNWIPDGDSCYFVSDVSVTWKEAEGHCHRYDSSLVEVPDTNKTDVIKSLLESQYTNHTTADKFFWIGGYGHNGDFIWKSNGKPISFQNWNKGNQLPVPGGHYEQLCLEMVQSSDFKWNYALCISTNPFVCERKKN